MSVLNNLLQVVKGSLNWRLERDDERPGKHVVLAETTAGTHVIQEEGDGTYSWVLMDVESGFPLDLRCNFRSLDEAKAHARKVWSGQ